MSPSVGSFDAVEHVVVLMLENRSFDHMLGFLYAAENNRSPSGDEFDGLTGDESNPTLSGDLITVSRVDPSAPMAYFTPGADPGEGFAATNDQLLAGATIADGVVAKMDGFVTNFASTIAWQTKEGGWDIVTGTTASEIMAMFPPAALPVLSGLARGYAVCDQWFSSVPTETMPNRAFASAATSQGHMDDKTKSFTVPSIFGSLDAAGLDWAIYGYSSDPLTRVNFPDTEQAADSHFGTFPDFRSAASAGTLGVYTFLEPSWSSTGNSQHPNYDVALGEQLIYDVYEALRAGPKWPSTLLIITYDEHGGCYDHVPPPSGAVPPDTTPGEYGFDFTRFGVRVPTVLISPLIEAGTVFRVDPAVGTLDHTSILATLERRWNIEPLTARDKAAPDLFTVISRTVPRTDDPLAGVVVPVSKGSNPAAATPSHLQVVFADLVAHLPVTAGEDVEHLDPSQSSPADVDAFINARLAAWKASRNR